MHLGAIDMDDGMSIDTASEFMSQYTARQLYRYTGHIDEFILSTDHQFHNCESKSLHFLPLPPNVETETNHSFSKEKETSLE